jgi:hypothetical protein
MPCLSILAGGVCRVEGYSVVGPLVEDIGSFFLIPGLAEVILNFNWRVESATGDESSKLMDLVKTLV